MKIVRDGGYFIIIPEFKDEIELLENTLKIFEETHGVTYKDKNGDIRIVKEKDLQL